MSHTKTVLITGASRGLGRQIALTLSKKYKLVLHASKLESLTNIVNELEADGISADLLPCDLTNNDDLKTFCKEFKNQYSESLYAIINNAGITLDKPIAFQPEEQIDKILQVNLKAPIMIGKSAFKIFLKNSYGNIINIGSIVGERGNAYQSVYSATKSALIGLTKSWAKEAGELNLTKVRVNCISPGFIESDMSLKIPDEVKQNFLDQIPLRRFGQANDVASLVSFLLSSESGYVNGCNIGINGGIN